MQISSNECAQHKTNTLLLCLCSSHNVIIVSAASEIIFYYARRARAPTKQNIFNSCSNICAHFAITKSKKPLSSSEISEPISCQTQPIAMQILIFSFLLQIKMGFSVSQFFGHFCMNFISNFSLLGGEKCKKYSLGWHGYLSSGKSHISKNKLLGI
jgi:hypothetical protein